MEKLPREVPNQSSPSELLPYVETEERIKLYNYDCLTGMQRVLPSNSVSVVVTSPPYNIGTKYNGYDDRKTEGEYITWMGQIASELKRVLEPSGSIFLNVGTKPSNPTIAWQVAIKFTETFRLQNVIHWIKSIAISKEDIGSSNSAKDNITIGHYKPTASRRYLHDSHEYIFHFTNTGDIELDLLAIGIPYQDKSNIGRWKSAVVDKRSRGNVWFIPYETITNLSQRPHPSTFPVNLPKMCLKIHGVPKVRLALDIFMGIGSTALACQKLGIPCVGFEIDSSYLDFAKERLTHKQLPLCSEDG